MPGLGNLPARSFPLPSLEIPAPASLPMATRPTPPPESLTPRVSSHRDPARTPELTPVRSPNPQPDFSPTAPSTPAQLGLFPKACRPTDSGFPNRSWPIRRPESLPAQAFRKLGPLKWFVGAPELYHWHHDRARDAGNYANISPLRMCKRPPALISPRRHRNLPLLPARAAG